jgi:phosphoserine aminotransferase
MNIQWSNRIDPHFGSGPCKKAFQFSWFMDDFYKNQDIMGRGHRSSFWIKRIQKLQAMIVKKLHIPHDYRFAFISAGTTGAMECLLWNLLGERTVDIFTGDPFGDIWRHDIINELKLTKYNDYKVAPGFLPPLEKYNPKHDSVFVYAGTPSGTQVPNLDWISEEREGLTICDAASAAFAFNLDWKKLDATAFAFQKALGSEAALGAIVLSPRAYKRLQEFTPENRATPRLFRLKPQGKILENIFNGYLINTPSLLAFEDIRRSLEVFPDDFEPLVHRNFNVVKAFVDAHPNLSFFAKGEAYISHIAPTIICDKFKMRDDYMRVVHTMEQKHWAYDINGHDLVEPCFRFWCGPNINDTDLQKMLERLGSVIDAK